MANQQGKRYVCQQCGSEMLVTRGGEGDLECCGAAMTLRGATTGAGGGARPAGAQGASNG